MHKYFLPFVAQLLHTFSEIHTERFAPRFSGKKYSLSSCTIPRNPIVLCALYSMLSIGLSGCLASQSHQTDITHSSQKQLSASEHFQLGHSLYIEWYQSRTQTLADIAKASEHLKKAWDSQTDNMRYLLNYYNAHAAESALLETFNESSLISLFNRLPQHLKADAISPAFVSFSRSEKNGETLNDQIKHILRASSQNPDNPQNWLILSQLYNLKKSYWLAIAAAEQADSISPNSLSYQQQLGVSVTKLASSELCPKNKKQLLTRASKIFAQAIKINSKDANLTAHSSTTYLHLNLKPLALAQAKKAYAIERNANTINALFLAQFLSGQFEAAWETSAEFKKQYGIDKGNFLSLEKYVEFHNNANQETLAPLVQAIHLADYQNNSAFHTLLTRYLFITKEENYLGILGALPEKFTEKERNVFAFFTEDRLNPDAFTLYNDENQNTCTDNTALFYKALAHEMNDQYSEANELFHDYLNSGPAITPEYLWAHLIMNKLYAE